MSDFSYKNHITDIISDARLEGKTEVETMIQLTDDCVASLKQSGYNPQKVYFMDQVYWRISW